MASTRTRSPDSNSMAMERSEELSPRRTSKAAVIRARRGSSRSGSFIGCIGYSRRSRVTDIAAVATYSGCFSEMTLRRGSIRSFARRNRLGRPHPAFPGRYAKVNGLENSARYPAVSRNILGDTASRFFDHCNARRWCMLRDDRISCCS